MHNHTGIDSPTRSLVLSSPVKQAFYNSYSSAANRAFEATISARELMSRHETRRPPATGQET